MLCKKIETGECTTCNKDKIIIAREGKCQYRLNNKAGKRICKVKIDGCYVKEGKRCDYLIVVCEKNDTYFIELKGRHFLDAIEQINQTMNYFKEELHGAVYARIVTTKISVPNLENNPKVLKLQRRLKNLGGNLKKATIQLSETI